MGPWSGRTALRRLVDYAFAALNLERIYAEAYGFNLRLQRLMERMGFQCEGILRQHALRNGVRQDMPVVGLLKTDVYHGYPTLFALPDPDLPP